MNTFETTKERIEQVNIETEMDCLQTIVLNVSEMCQFHCSFCPRSKGYENRENFMDTKTAFQIKQRLDEINYKGTISISGMGEPFLNEDLYKIVEILMLGEPEYSIQILTNGATENVDYYKFLDLGVKIIVSIHDEAINKNLAIKKFNSDKIIYRDHTTKSKEMKVTNRAGYMGEDKTNLLNPCYYPFYKIVIDYNGDYLQCQEDWLRDSKEDGANVFDMGIEEFFIDDLFIIKKSLLVYGRSHRWQLCSKCNVEGIAMGGKEVEYFKTKYDVHSNEDQ